jgi:hypothetical protein
VKGTKNMKTNTKRVLRQVELYVIGLIFTCLFIVAAQKLGTVTVNETPLPIQNLEIALLLTLPAWTVMYVLREPILNTVFLVSYALLGKLDVAGVLLTVFTVPGVIGSILMLGTLAAMPCVRINANYYTAVVLGFGAWISVVWGFMEYLKPFVEISSR